jgi:hypothetical protein
MDGFTQSFQIRNSNPVYGFDLTINVTKKLDTLGMILYSGESNIDTTEYFAQLVQSDSSFRVMMNQGVTPQDSDYIPPGDSLADPLYINRLMFSSLHNNTSELYYNEIIQNDTIIKCAELGISFKDDDEIERELFARIYYNGHDIYTFVIIGLKRRESALIELKNNFFNSIFIN